MKIVSFKQTPDKNGYFFTIRRLFKKDKTYFFTTDFKMYDEEGNYIRTNNSNFGAYTLYCLMRDYINDIYNKKEAKRMKEYIQQQKQKLYE